MSAIPKKVFTEAEYLEFERISEQKHEFYNGELFAMAGASRQHNIVKENLSIEIGSRLKGGPCLTLSGDQRVKMDRARHYTYPDFIIVCGQPQYDNVDPDALINPQVIVEILSQSTEAYDRGVKFRHFQRIRSVREYVLISQDKMQVERFVRQPDETWVLTTFDDPIGDFSLSTVAVSIPLADVYRSVELPADSGS